MRVELAGREIVEEEERLGALHDEIVDAHRDEIDADRVVMAGLDGDAQLGADAVIGRDQQRIVVAGRLRIEDAAEATDLGIRARPPRRLDQRLDELDEKIAGVDIDPGIGIAEGIGTGALVDHRGLPVAMAQGGP